MENFLNLFRENRFYDFGGMSFKFLVSTIRLVYCVFAGGQSGMMVGHFLCVNRF